MTTGTEVAIPKDLPSYLTKYTDKLPDNAGAIGGINAASWPRINIGGSKFSIVEGGEKKLISDPRNPALPLMQLDLVVVGHNPGVSKVFYSGDWEEGDANEPDCSSDDGITPDPNIAHPQSNACSTCPQNVWGSAISKQSQKPIKACSDQKRLVVLPVHDLKGKALDFSVKPSALKDWANYVRDLSARGIKLQTCVTLFYFDPAANYPKVLFKFGRFLTEEELAVVSDRADGDDVKLIASPRRTIQIKPAITPPASAPAAAPIVPQATPPAQAAPQPTPAAPPADPFAGQPDYVKTAVTAAGGIESDSGKTVFKQLTGKDVPSAQPEAPSDPYAGQPDYVKLAVETAGGLSTEKGRLVFKQLTGKDAPVPSRGRGRPRKATEAPPATQPAAPAAPAAPSAGFSSAPENTATAGNLGGSLDDLLSKALNTPTK